MSITVFRGLPGSGKSKRLIEVVKAEQAAGRQTMTVVSADADWVTGYDSYTSQRVLASRQENGPTCGIDHFLETFELDRVLADVNPGTLVAIEEAQMFGSSVADVWTKSAARGVDFIIVSPSAEQIERLGSDYSTVTFTVRCKICGMRDAVTAVLDARTDGVLSLCRPCFESERANARERVVQLLIEELPHRGEQAVYQPVELPECSEWSVSRPDSDARATLIQGVMQELGLLGGSHTGHHTYLDIGCSTGFFCSRFQRAGIYAKGIDAVENNIMIAKLLDSFVRRQHRPNKKFATFVVGDAYEYLRDTPHERFDAVSAFSVIQWIMTQRSIDEALRCFDWIFAKTKRLCVIEMGYSSQDRYDELLPINVDRDWVERTMERGGFSEVRVVDADRAGIMRDLFIGIRDDGTMVEAQ
jgi:SAM-dependent methyltransferase